MYGILSVKDIFQVLPMNQITYEEVISHRTETDALCVIVKAGKDEGYLLRISDVK
jgi:hypothetical protein